MRDLEDRLRRDFGSAMNELPVTTPHPASVKARTAEQPGRARSPRGVVRRPVLVGLAAVGATAAALVAPTIVPLGGGPAGTAAAAVLAQAADSAAAAPRATPAPGQFLYLRDVGSQEDVNGSGGRCGVVYERWTAADGAPAGRIVRHDGVNVPASGWNGDPATLPRQQGCYQGLIDTTDVPPPDGTWQTPTARFVATLPTDPQALYERVAADIAREGHALQDQQAFVYLADLLISGSPYLSPELKAAVYRAIALVPGVQNLGTTTDLLGREGTALAGPENDKEDTLILDPRTGEVLGEGGPFAVARTYGIVDDTRSRPRS